MTAFRTGSYEEGQIIRAFDVNNWGFWEIRRFDAPGKTGKISSVGCEFG
jgi:hypothetical protein